MVAQNDRSARGWRVIGTGIPSQLGGPHPQAATQNPQNSTSVRLLGWERRSSRAILVANIERYLPPPREAELPSPY